MTTADFAAYSALIIGDNNNSHTPADVQAAVDNASVWGAAVTGNIMLHGADPEAIGNAGAIAFIDRSIAFAAATPGHTGAFVSFNYYQYSYAPTSPAPLLDAFAPGGFTVSGFKYCCYGSNDYGLDTIYIDARQVPETPAPTGLTNDQMSYWGYTTYSWAPTYPKSFKVWAIGWNDDPGQYTTREGDNGYPTFLVSERTPPSSSAQASCNGVVTFTNTDNPGGSGAKSVHYRVDAGPEQSAATAGAPPATGFITLPAGSHSLEFWAEDRFGNLEPAHHTITAVKDTAPPTVSVSSDQKTNTFNAGQAASITTVASDAASALTTDPSRAKEPLAVPHAGEFSVTKTAVDACGNTGTGLFAYSVLPVDSSLRLSPSSFKPAAEGGSVAKAKKKAAGGSAVSYTASDAGITTFQVFRIVRGRATLVPGSFTHTDRAGGNRFRFTGRVGGSSLTPGTYRLTGVPKAVGETGPPASARCTIK
jgi:hypothetical protein